MQNLDIRHDAVNQNMPVTRLDRAIIKYNDNKRCPLCNKEFEGTVEFTEHFKFLHKYELFECVMCPFHCSTLNEFYDHLTENHDKAVSMCGNVPEIIKAEF